MVHEQNINAKIKKKYEFKEKKVTERNTLTKCLILLLQMYDTNNYK